MIKNLTTLLSTSLITYGITGNIYSIPTTVFFTLFCIAIIDDWRNDRDFC